MAMRLVDSIGTYQAEGNSFKGLEIKPFGEAGSFYDMLNMSGEHWPVLKTRGKRRKIRNFTDFEGFFGHDGAGWIDNGKVYWNGVEKMTVTAGAKTIVEMGAKAMIWPDKVWVNMEDGTTGNLENTVTFTGDVHYNTCDLEGSYVAYSVALYVKVRATGIGAGFKDNDVVKFEGGTVLEDGNYQIYTVTDDSFVVLATMNQSYKTDFSSTITASRTVPDMDYMVESDNRIWGCSSDKHEIYCCALGSPENWNTYQGLANDSFAVTVGTPGDFTGAATHMGYVLFFKEDVIHKIFGNKPSNFQVTTVHAKGVEDGSAGSLCLMDETLYYKARTGIVSYDGSLPEDVGAAIGYRKHHNAVSGGNDGRMWVSMQDAEDDWHLFVLDTRNGYWYREDASHAEGFLSVNGSLYMAKDGALWLIEGDGDPGLETADAEDEGTISWMAETGDLDMNDLYKRHLQKIMLRLRLKGNAVCNIKVQYDGGAWETLKTLTGKDNKNAVNVPIIPHRCDHMRIRMDGTGDMRLVQMNYVIWRGSEL